MHELELGFQSTSYSVTFNTPSHDGLDRALDFLVGETLEYNPSL
jgi:hypothetical protein